MPTLFIDKTLLKDNIEITKQLAGESHIIGIVKGNGYGLGLCSYAHILVESGIEILAVTELDDAIQLRNSGIHCDILMLSPLYQQEDIRTALSLSLILCITSYECGVIAEETAAKLSTYGRAHICIDTGLGRYGFPDTHVKDIIYTVRHMKHICVTGIYSHFFASACRKPKHTAEQLERFLSLCKALEKENIFIGFRHIAASCALLRYPETRLDAVRIGSAFLGRLPMKNQWGYRPVGLLEAPVSDIHTLPPGHNIGYGHTFITTKKTTVAIVPVGYSHGLGVKRGNDCPSLTCLPRFIGSLIKNTLFPKKLYGFYKENQFPVLGKIGMTHVILDVTGAELHIGDIIQLPVNPIYVDSSIPRRY